MAWEGNECAREARVGVIFKPCQRRWDLWHITARTVSYGTSWVKQGCRLGNRCGLCGQSQPFVPEIIPQMQRCNLYWTAGVSEQQAVVQRAHDGMAAYGMAVYVGLLLSFTGPLYIHAYHVVPMWRG